MLAAAYEWQVRTADVSTAFLHAQVEGEVYVRPPKHLQLERPGEVWRLKRALYGLRSAPRSWQQHAAQVLGALGWERMQVDTSVYRKLGANGEPAGMVVLYVDDVLAAGEPDELGGFYDKFAAEVVLKTQEPLQEGGKEKYLGVEIERTKNGFRLDASEYTEKLVADAGLQNCKPVATPGLAATRCDDSRKLSKSEHSEYRRRVGQLLWLANARKDLCFAVKELSRHVHDPTEQDARACKRVLRYLRGTQHCKVPLSPCVRDGAFTLEVYSDSDWAGCGESRRSTSGGRIML